MIKYETLCVVAVGCSEKSGHKWTREDSDFNMISAKRRKLGEFSLQPIKHCLLGVLKWQSQPIKSFTSLKQWRQLTGLAKKKLEMDLFRNFWCPERLDCLGGGTNMEFPVSSCMCSECKKSYQQYRRQYPNVFIIVILFTLILCCNKVTLVPGTNAVLAEGNGFLFLPPAFRFLKYCKPTEYKCIEQNTLELWYDLKRYNVWKRNYPESSRDWTNKHPQLSDWLESEYSRLRVYFVDENH